MKTIANTERIKRNKSAATDSRPIWRVYGLIVICALLFVTGFFLAGKQHFSSMDYGMKNSKLRKQVEDLESEKRRLILAREVSLTPNEIKKAARKVGLTEPERSRSEIARIEAIKSETKALNGSDISPPKVVKTSLIKQVSPESPEKQTRPKKEVGQNRKKEKVMSGKASVK